MPILGLGKSDFKKLIFRVADIVSMPLSTDYKTNFLGPKIGMNQAYIYWISHAKYLSHT
jgi:hypothetical protein